MTTRQITAGATHPAAAGQVDDPSIAVEGREKSKKLVQPHTVRQRASEDEDLGSVRRPARRS